MVSSGRRTVDFLTAVPLREVLWLVSSPCIAPMLNLRPVLFPLATRVLSGADQSERARKMAERRTPAAFLTRRAVPRFCPNAFRVRSLLSPVKEKSAPADARHTNVPAASCILSLCRSPSNRRLVGRCKQILTLRLHCPPHLSICKKI